MFIYLKAFLWEKGSAKENEKKTRDFLLEYALKANGIDINNISIVKSEHGKPYINDNKVFFNISHTKGLCAVAVSAAELGVDTELIKERKNYVEKRFCNKAELEYLEKSNSFINDYYKIWTYKEAYSKLTGSGLTSDFRTINSLVSPEGKSVFTDIININNQNFYLTAIEDKENAEFNVILL